MAEALRSDWVNGNALRVYFNSEFEIFNLHNFIIRMNVEVAMFDFHSKLINPHHTACNENRTHTPVVMICVLMLQNLWMAWSWKWIERRNETVKQSYGQNSAVLCEYTWERRREGGRGGGVGSKNSTSKMPHGGVAFYSALYVLLLLLVHHDAFWCST